MTGSPGASLCGPGRGCHPGRRTSSRPGHLVQRAPHAPVTGRSVTRSGEFEHDPIGKEHGPPARRQGGAHGGRAAVPAAGGFCARAGNARGVAVIEAQVIRKRVRFACARHLITGRRPSATHCRALPIDIALTCGSCTHSRSENVRFKIQTQDRFGSSVEACRLPHPPPGSSTVDVSSATGSEPPAYRPTSPKRNSPSWPASTGRP